MGKFSRKNKAQNGCRVMHPNHPSDAAPPRRSHLSSRQESVLSVFKASFKPNEPILAGRKIGTFVLTKAYLNKLAVAGVLRGHYVRANDGWRRFYTVLE